MLAVDTEITLAGFLKGGLRCVLIVTLALLFARLGSRFVARSIRSIATRSPLRESSPRAEQRATTLAGVAVSLTRIVIWSIAGLLLLGVLGFDLGPFLAGASIVGVALGFGAQSLVKDFFSGFFILAEDQYAVGDTITLAETTGIVEEINLRITRVRAADGTVWFVPNGEIRKVGNSTKEWGRSIVDVLVPNKADLAAVTAAVSEEAAALAEDPAWAGDVLEAPEVLGVETVTAENVTLRISTKTTPARRTPLAREMRARITRRLQRDGVIVGEPAKPATPATPES
jgi:small-conductance mechanosensitive channel